MEHEHNKIECTVAILTFNSESTLRRALESVRDFADVLVCDGNSSDNTREIAVAAGARVIRQRDESYGETPIADFSEMRNRCISNARYNWVLFLDSDEAISQLLAEEIRGIVNRGGPHRAYRIPNRIIADGREIKYATPYPGYQIRFFNRSTGYRYIKSVHERLDVPRSDRIGTLRGPWYVFADDADWADFIGRMHFYVDKEVLRARKQTAAQFFYWTVLGKPVWICKMLAKVTWVYVRHGFKESLPIRHEARRLIYTTYLTWRLVLDRLVRFISGIAVVRPIVFWILSAAYRASQMIHPTRGGIAVLFYHSVGSGEWEFTVSPESFRRQLDSFARWGFTPVTLHDLECILLHKQQPPRRGVLITFDDGYRDIAKNALPLLAERCITPVIFVHTNRSSELLGNTLPLLTWDELRSLSGSVDFGNHSHEHSTLRALSLTALEADIQTSEAIFLHEIGRVTAYAYPAGKYNGDVVEILRKRGYSTAYTITPGLVRPGDDPLRLRRIGVTSRTSAIELHAHMIGAGEWYGRCIHFVKSLFGIKTKSI